MELSSQTVEASERRSLTSWVFKWCLIVLEYFELVLVVVMFHDAVKRDDVTVGIDIEQRVSNTVKNSTEKEESISSHNCREYVDYNNCDIN